MEVNLIIENYARRPFYRIEIPSGKEKPYCTAGGTYKIRGDGRTNTLLPGRLLSLFVEKQSEIFFNRFREATKELGRTMMSTNAIQQEELHELLNRILNMEYMMETRLSRLEEGLGNKESTVCNIDSLAVGITRLKERMSHLEKGISRLEDKIDKLIN